MVQIASSGIRSDALAQRERERPRAPHLLLLESSKHQRDKGQVPGRRDKVLTLRAATSRHEGHCTNKTRVRCRRPSLSLRGEGEDEDEDERCSSTTHTHEVEVEVEYEYEYEYEYECKVQVQVQVEGGAGARNT